MNNDLLPTEVTVQYEHALEVPQEYFFFKGFAGKSFIDKLIEKTIHDSLTVFYPFSQSAAYTIDEFKERVQAVKNDISHLIFNEAWVLDTAQFVMTKTVRSYTLVREYVRYGDTVKSLVATYHNQYNGDSFFKEGATLLARNVAYEVPLLNGENPEWVENISRKRLAQLLIDKVLSGEQAYSFYYRDSLQAFSLDEAKRRLGEETNYELMYNELDGTTDTVAISRVIDVNEFVAVAFIEDWYYDEATMRIFKDVKGIAPVRQYDMTLSNGDIESVRRIPLLLFFANHKEGK
jgi:hypothetical protein